MQYDIFHGIYQGVTNGDYVSIAMVARPRHLSGGDS